jgi:hypothetical protein
MQERNTMPIDQPPGKAIKSETSCTPIEAGPLAEEIRFWQEMLSAMEGADQPQERVERVKQALALAQYRLASVQSPCRY